jgi:hypothetical protein
VRNLKSGAEKRVSPELTDGRVQTEAFNNFLGRDRVCVCVCKCVSVCASARVLA